MIHRRCFVSGRVQGVFYRATAARRAQELALRGHARNLEDGRVEVLVAGPAAEVEEFVAWLWIGSSASKVTAVEVLPLDPEEAGSPQGFTTG